MSYFNKINKSYRYFVRYREIAVIIIKYGLDSYFINAKLRAYFKISSKTNKKIQSVPFYKRIRLALEELGPTFIKFGQVLSNRPDIIPLGLIDELEHLQSNVKPFLGKDVEKIIEKEFNKKYDEVFKNFSLKPIASASIAQVHKARLLTGEEVAVKIQRPDIEKTIKTDLEIMYHLAITAEKFFSNLKLFSPSSFIKEFEKTINKELNFFIEAAYLEKFAKNFSDDDSIHVPKLYRDYSTRKIITMEFIDGIKVSDIDKLKESNADIKKIAVNGVNFILKQIFEHGFFHADPHPGNIFILKNDVICFLDYGMMGFVNPKYNNYIGELIIAYVNNDAKIITKNILNITGNKLFKYFDDLEHDINIMLEEYSLLTLKEANISVLLSETIKIIYKYKLKIPSDIYLLVKALITIEGVGRKLDPEIKLLEYTKPYAKKILKQKTDPLRLYKELTSSTINYAHFFKELPYELKEIIEKLINGKLNIVFEHQGLDNVLQKSDKVSNRLSFAIVLASLIISSSLIIHSKVPPLYNNISIIGIIGYIASGILGFWLLYSIIKNKGL